jgi:hypothetical protein
MARNREFDEVVEYKGRSFGVRYPYDEDAEPPWEQGDGHGKVSEWVRGSCGERPHKAPGEWIIASDHTAHRVYDAQEALKRARAEEWSTGKAEDTYPQVSKKEQAARAVKADFEWMRRWCADQWHYIGVVVMLLDEEDDETPTEYEESVWSVEGDTDTPEGRAYIKSIVEELADECPLARAAEWKECPTCKGTGKVAADGV